MVKVANPAMQCAIGDDLDGRRQVTMPAAENPPINTVSTISAREGKTRSERMALGHCSEYQNYGHYLHHVTQQSCTDNTDYQKAHQHAG